MKTWMLIFTCLTFLLGACKSEQVELQETTSTPEKSESTDTIFAIETPRQLPTETPLLTQTPEPSLTPTEVPSPSPVSDTPEGYKNYSIPNWISLDIPEDWYSIRPPELGRITLSNMDIDFPYFSLKEGTALVMLFDYGDPDQSPLENLETDYIESLFEDRIIIETPESITINDLEAATMQYTSPQPEGTAIEQITIINDHGRSIAILTAALESEFNDFEPQFTEMINSLRIYPVAPSPVIKELAEGTLDSYQLYKDDVRGLWFQYPKDWDVIDEMGGSLGLILKPPEVENYEEIIGTVVILPPEVMKVYGMDGDEDRLEAYLYNMLFGYGRLAIEDVQVTSFPEVENVGAQEFLPVMVGATIEGTPISGIFAVVRKEDQVVGLFTWMHEFDKHIDHVESILSSLTPIPTYKSGDTLSDEQYLDMITEAVDQYYNVDFEGAIETCSEILDYSLDNERKAQVYAWRAYNYRIFGNIDSALEDYLKAYELGNKDGGITVNNICWYYALVLQPEKGLPFCEEAVEIEPSASHIDSRGLTYALLGDFEAAIIDFQEVVELWEIEKGYSHPDYQSRVEWLSALKDGENPITTDVIEQLNQPNYLGIAKDYIENGFYDSAIKAFTLAIEQNPELIEAYNQRGILYADYKHEFDLAIKDYNKVLELDSKNIQAYINRGNAYDLKGDPDRAIEDYNSALEINPQLAEALHNRGLAYYRKQEYDRALDDFDRAIELKPDYSYAYNSRCLLFRTKGDLEKALDDCNKAIELEPNFAMALFNRGFVLNQLGDVDKAVLDLSRSIELNPQYAPAYVIRGYIYADLGETQSAIADLQQALTVGLEPSAKAEVEKVLESLGN
jgi:tetratricopeptide (TPR) repeat protein